ncbi:MAG: hypothetical protein IPH11_13830 [Ignavibacteriales bacterium]|nr:hypothetical protein [Ignavibacteriales bacterium]
MSQLPEIVRKYLNKFSASDRKIICSDLSAIDNVIVIPAIDEYQNIISLLNSLSEMDRKYFSSSLFLFVINNSASSSNGIKAGNKSSIELISKIIFKINGAEFLNKIIESNLRIALIDASSSGNELPEKDAGVGLARKIGMDTALNIYNYNSLLKKLLICLDADCKVEKNYLTAIISYFNYNKSNASVVRFAHDISGNDENTKAIICYETFLRYYVLGLKYADSPFALHTLGSTMICDVESYIKVDGMNKRKAAEDFYFLEKLAKHFFVQTINGTTITPSSRSSWRVPFGTGQRVNRFLQSSRDEYKLFNPASFEILNNWLRIFNSQNILTAEEYLKEAEYIHIELKNFLIQKKFIESWNSIIGRSKSTEQINKQKIFWFDGFNTLKLIHHLRDTSFPEINMYEALDILFHLMNLNPEIKMDKIGVPDLIIQKKYLNYLREII